MKIKHYLPFLLLSIVASWGLRAQSTNPELNPVTRTIALTNVHIIPEPGKLIESGTIIIKDGLIHSVGKDLSIPAEAKVVAADSMYAYSGFIDGLSHIGVPKPKQEEGAQRRRGRRNPDVKDPGKPTNQQAGIEPEKRVRTVLNPSEKTIGEMRKLGFTAANVVPRGRMLPGSGAVILLAGSTAEDMVLKEETCLFAQLNGARGVYPNTVIGVMSKLRELYKQAEQAKQHEMAYEERPGGMKRPAYDPSTKAFYSTIDGEQSIFFHAPDVKSLYRIMTLQKDLGFPVAFVNVKEGWHVSKDLKQSKAPIFLSLDLPEEKNKKGDKKEKGQEQGKEKPKGEMKEKAKTEKSAETKEDAPTPEEKELEKKRAAEMEKFLSQAADFEKEGIPFGFASVSVKAKDVRGNLRKMVEKGLSEDAALAALTTYPAQQLGLGKALGTIEQGKIANLVITNKPYFEKESGIRYVIVDGELFEYELKEKKKSNPTAKIAVAGEWNYSVNVPGQTTEGVLKLQEVDDGVAGSISNPETGNTTPISNAVLEGNKLSFSVSFEIGGESVPLSFEVVIDGDDMEGSVSAGPYGSFDLEGSRTSTPNN